MSGGARSSGGPAVLEVLFVLDSLSLNGAVVVTTSLVSGWPGGAARLAVLRVADASAAVTAQPPPLELTATGSRLRWTALPALRRLVHLARHADVVLAGSEIGPALLFAHLAARLTRRPLVVAVHADLDMALDEWVPRVLHGSYRRVHRSVRGAICVEEELVAPLVRNGLPEERVRVVRNGVDVAGVRRRAAHGTSLVRTDLPVLVATGRLAHQKGYDLLLHAHARAVARVPHELLVLNDGPLREELGRLAAELAITGSVHFAGAVDDPLPSVAQATAFVLPSRHEGLPLALLEAQVLGVPVIAADCSRGVRTALEDGLGGELVPTEDVDALTDALVRHLVDPSPLRRRAARGPVMAKTFDLDVMTSGWEQALVSLVGERRPRAGAATPRPSG